MNEITHIHLGRQPFTIAVDARKELQDYLHDIKQQVGDSHKEVIEEVELRMAELLAERGIKGDKVVLLEDIKYLQEQLGSPADFKEDDEPTGAASESSAPRRLFRDTQHGMIAGVAAGIAAYLNIDPVVIRLLFVVTVFAGGWGILLYIILWLVVPEAKTSSERLQMRGRPVTVDSLKDVVDRADVGGAARRASNTFGRALETMAKVALGVIGVMMALAGSLLLLALMTAGAFMALHHGLPFHDASGVLTPVTGKELAAVVAAMLVAAVIGMSVILIGIAMAKRKWQLPAWGVATLVGLMIIGLAAGGALVPDVASTLRSRYQAAQHVVTRKTEPFTSVQLEDGGQEALVYEQSNTYSVQIDYVGSADVSTVSTTVSKGVLHIDASKFYSTQTCNSPCFFSDHDLKVIVRAPQQPDGMWPTDAMMPPKPRMVLPTRYYAQ